MNMNYKIIIFQFLTAYITSYLTKKWHVCGFLPKYRYIHTNWRSRVTTNNDIIITHSTYSKKHIDNDIDYDYNSMSLNLNEEKEKIINAFTLAKPPNETTLLSKNLKNGTRIIAFGDIHGDIDALRNLLLLSNILHADSTNDNPIWNEDCTDTIVIQCGDILDRYHNELACVRMICKLSHQAVQYDSSVICILGNHEILNCLGSFKYTTNDGNDEFESIFGPYLDSLGNNDNNKKWRIQYAKNQPCRWNVFEPGIGIVSKNVLRNMKVALIVGKSLFVHAGLTKEHLLHYNNSIPKMNDDAYQWITSLHHNETNKYNNGNYESIDHLLASVQRRMNICYDTLPYCLSGTSASPICMRDYSNPADAEPSILKQEMIDDALVHVGNDVQRMVMGHTPQSYINAALKGKAYRVDVGVSRGVKNGNPEVLEIIHNGDEKDDSIHILTMDGGRIPAIDRHVIDFDF